MAVSYRPPQNRFANRFGTSRRDPVSGNLVPGEYDQYGNPLNGQPPQPSVFRPVAQPQPQPTPATVNPQSVMQRVGGAAMSAFNPLMGAAMSATAQPTVTPPAPVAPTGDPSIVQGRGYSPKGSVFNQAFAPRKPQAEPVNDWKSIVDAGRLKMGLPTSQQAQASQATSARVAAAAGTGQSVQTPYGTVSSSKVSPFRPLEQTGVTASARTRGEIPSAPSITASQPSAPASRPPYVPTPSSVQFPQTLQAPGSSYVMDQLNGPRLGIKSRRSAFPANTVTPAVEARNSAFSLKPSDGSQQGPSMAEPARTSEDDENDMAIAASPFKSRFRTRSSPAMPQAQPPVDVSSYAGGEDDSQSIFRWLRKPRQNGTLVNSY